MEFVTDLIKGINSPRKGEFIFKSTDHIRYQNGQNVSGHNHGCNRTIKFEPNVNGGSGYTVTIFNDDAIHPLWGTNIQMAPKQMKPVKMTTNTVTLQGYGFDIMGASFSNYAMTLCHDGREIFKCILHMLDRGVEIEYLKY